MNKNILNPEYDKTIDHEETLRPQKLVEYVGQEKIKETLKVFIHGAKTRNESLDHVLLYGPPGLGKTTLSNIIANEMGTNIKLTTGPAINRAGDLAAILSSLDEGDILFIDEIHRIPKIVEELLYSAMEDFAIDIIIGKDTTASTLRIDLPPFTLIGATTRFGDLTAPIRDRFGIVNQLIYYNEEELSKIIKRTAKILNYKINDEAVCELAKRSRGTPRIANRLFRRIRDFAQYENKEVIDLVTTNNALDKLNIDKGGLDYGDCEYLKCLIEKYHGGPVGLESLAATMNVESVTIEDVNEPFLLQEGYIIRTSRGRVATQKAYDHLNYGKEGLL